MQHVVLLGDSVFDNGAYVGDGPDVVAQLRAILPRGWHASMGAVDGAGLGDVRLQLSRLPADATHLAISVGGNDALVDAGVLDESARSVAGALEKLMGVRDRFQESYRQMLADVCGRSLRTAICTIYEPRFPDLQLRKLTATALTILNDCIVREAFVRELTLIDLRLICDRDDDFANPIEPSVRGGERIAQAIARFASGSASSVRVIAG